MSTQLIRTARYAGMAELTHALDSQRHYRQDIVAPLNTIRSTGALIEIAGMGQVLTDDGVSTAAAYYRPFKAFDDGLADRLPGIGRGTLAGLRNGDPARNIPPRPDVYDAIVNMIVQGNTVTGPGGVTTYPPVTTNVLMRLFAPEKHGDPGWARAMLSDGYKPMDNVDLWFLLLGAIARAQDEGRIPPQGDPAAPIVHSNLTEDAMDVTVRFPSITAISEDFVRNYRDPFRDGAATRTHWWRPSDGGPRGHRGQVDLCLRLSNGEIGNRSLRLAPELWMWECGNGQVCVSEQIKAIHVGGRLEPGEIQWSQETQNAAMKLALSKLGDALARFLAPGYIDKVIEKLMTNADAPITGDPADAIRFVSTECGIPKDLQNDLLRHFSLGGDWTSGGIGFAVTSLAQELDDPAAAMDLEWNAEKATAKAAEFVKAAAKAGPAGPA